MVRKFLLILWCFLHAYCFGQDNAINYATKDGLASNQVYDIYQDKNGVMWFATDRGISSFNGSFFTNFATIDGLLSDVIFDFFPQKDGTIWCSTDKNKLFFFNPIEKIFTPFRYNHLLPENKGHEIKSLLIDNNEYFIRYLGMTGYFKIDSKGKTSSNQLNLVKLGPVNYYIQHLKGDFYYYSTNGKNAINKKPFVGVARDLVLKNNENVVKMTYNGLYIFDQNGDQKSNRLTESDELLQIGETKEKTIWVTGFGIGVKLINKHGEVYQSYLDGLACSKYFKDKDNSVWISTLSNGIYLIPASKILNFKLGENEHITSVSVYADNLAFGTLNGSTTNYSYSSKKSTRNIAATTGIIKYFNGTLISNILRNKTSYGYIRRISENFSRKAIITGFNFIFEANNEKKLIITRERIYDSEFYGANFIVAEGEYIKIYDPNNKVVDSINLFTRTNDLDFVDSKLYCATSTKGLIILDKNLKTIGAINVKSGLKSNYVNDVKIHNGEIWLATRNGISRVTKYASRKQRISTISVENGLNDQEVNDFDFMGDTIFIGTRMGINYLRVSDWEQIVSKKTSIFFSLKEINLRGEKLKNTINLAYFQNDLTFEIELATYQINKNITFRYKLEGIDKNWSTTRSRVMNFKSLPPGEYTLLIQANVNDNWHEKIIRQKISIIPPWYSSWIFISAIVFTSIAIIWLFFKYRVLNYNREILREILRQTMKRMKRKEKVLVVRSNGQDIKILSENILYVEASRNYITIYTTGKKVVVREKISNFLSYVPDPLEYIQINRSIIARIDYIRSKSVDTVTIGEVEIKVGGTYLNNLKKIQF